MNRYIFDALYLLKFSFIGKFQRSYTFVMYYYTTFRLTTNQPYYWMTSTWSSTLKQASSAAQDEAS